VTVDCELRVLKLKCVLVEVSQVVAKISNVTLLHNSVSSMCVTVDCVFKLLKYVNTYVCKRI